MKSRSRQTRKKMHRPILHHQNVKPESNSRKTDFLDYFSWGREECAHCSDDIALTMLEKDTLVYLGPEKFPTRRNELQLKKPGKEIAIDQSQLIVKEKPADLTCSTNTELEVANAFRRRALAFDLVGICSYNIMTSYHADLLDHLHIPVTHNYHSAGP